MGKAMNTINICNYVFLSCTWILYLKEKNYEDIYG